MSGKRLKSLKNRYFAVYSVLSLLPVLIFAFIYRFGILSEYRKDLVEEERISSMKLLSYMDYRTQSLMRYASTFSNYIYGNIEDMRREGLDEATAEAIAGMLSGYEEEFGPGLRAYCYEKGSKRICSDHGVMSWKRFEETCIPDVSPSRIPMFSLANHLNFCLVRHDYPLTVFFCPVPELSLFPTATLIFIVDNASLEADFRSFFGSADPCYDVISPRGERIISSSSPVMEDDRQYMTFSLRSESSGNILRCSFRSSEVLAPYRMRTALFWFVTAFLSAALLVLARYLANVSYMPIRNLMNIIGHRDYTIHRDEMKFLTENLTGFVDENSRLRDSLDSQSAVLERIVMNKLLLGEMDSRDSGMEEVLGHFSAMTGYGFFQVVLLDLLPDEEEDDEPVDLTVIRAYIRSLEAEDMMTYVPELSCSDSVIVVIGSSSCSAERNADMLMEELGKRFSLSFRAASSHVHSDIMDLNIAYMEAGLAFEKAVPGRMNHYEAGKPAAVHHVISTGDNNLFQHAVRSGDLSAALKILSGMFTYVEESKAIPVLKQGMLYDIYNMVLRSIESIGCTDAPLTHIHPDVRDMAGFRDGLTKVLSSEIGRWNDAQSSARSEEISEIIGYVDRNFRSNQISLQELSDRFGLSLSSLSRLFKNEVGSGFADYLAGLRFSWMKGELETSDRILKDIILDSGYTNVSGTMKKFKEREGMTMKEWRDGRRGE